MTELTDLVDLDGWPSGSRLIARRERLAGEEQLRPVADHGEWRLEVFLTDHAGDDLPELARQGARRARVARRSGQLVACERSHITSCSPAATRILASRI
jgi:hypothetical protein